MHSNTAAMSTSNHGMIPCDPCTLPCGCRFADPLDTSMRTQGCFAALCPVAEQAISFCSRLHVH